MIEITGDIWELAKQADAICIPTNGTLRKNGTGIMGAGLAKQAAEKLGPCAEKSLGLHIKSKGNIPMSLGYIRPEGSCACWRYEPPITQIERICEIWTIPTKGDWRQGSDMGLMLSGLKLIVEMTTAMKFKKVLLVKIGCGLGGLEWDEVKKQIEPILDDRFVICCPPSF